MTVGPNVGHAEVDVDLDVDHLVAQGREAGQEAGEEYGEGFFRSADGKLRDAQGKFVSESRTSGRKSGTAFGNSFNRGLRGAFSKGNPFSGLQAQAELQSNRILATFVRLGPLIFAALGAAVAIGPAIAAGLPALAGMAAIIAVMIAGWDKFQKVIIPFDKMFRKIGNSVEDILTDGLIPLAKEAADVLFPVLKSGLGEVAEATNNVITGFLNWVSASDTLSLIEKLLTGVAPIMNTLGQAAIVFSDALLRVSVAALPAFETLVDFLLGGAVAFDDWIKGLERTGELSSSISDSMDILLALLSEFAGLLGQILVLGNELGPAGLAFFVGLGDVLSILIDLLQPVARALSENAESVQLFAQALGTLILISSGLQVLALILSGAVGLLALLAAAFTVAFQNSAQFRDVVAQVGVFAQTQLIPALQAIATFITGTVVPALQQFAQFFVAEILPPLQQFATFIQTVVIPAVVQLATFFAGIGQALGQFIVFLQPVIEFLAGQFLPALVQLGEAIGVLFSAVVQLAQAFGPILKPALIALGAIIIGGLLVAFAQIIIVIKAVSIAIQIFAAGIRIAAQVVAFLIGVGQQLIGIIGGALSGALGAAQGALSAVAGAARTVIGVVTSLIGFVSNLIGRLGALPPSIPNPFGAWDFITTVIGWVRDLIGFLGDIPGSLPNPLDWDIDVLGPIESVLDALSSIPSSLPNPFSGWSIPDVPSLPFGLGAMGGIFDSATPMIIGEAGREVLVPLTKPDRALSLLEQSGAADLLRRAGRGGSDGASQTGMFGDVHIHSNAADAESVVEQLINRLPSRVVR